MTKQYIGDSVYADYDGYHVILTTNNGMGDTNTIYLDESTYHNLRRYVQATTGVKPEEVQDE